MFQPGSPASAIKGEDWLVKKVADLEQQIRELRAANPFAPMGMIPHAGLVEFTGAIQTDSSATSTFNGSVIINGDLSVPNGSISNAALANPITPLAQHAGTSGFGLATGANSTLLTTTINVPSGCSQALVFAAGVLHAYNNNAAPDDAYAVVSIAGTVVGASSQGTAASGADLSLPATATKLITGLGASFDVSVLGSSGVSGWAANSVNFINLDVFAIFLR
jgi:hypothetical protein